MKVYLLQLLHDGPGIIGTLGVYRDKQHAHREMVGMQQKEPTSLFRIQEMEMIYDLQPK